MKLPKKWNEYNLIKHSGQIYVISDCMPHSHVYDSNGYIIIMFLWAMVISYCMSTTKKKEII